MNFLKETSVDAHWFFLSFSLGGFNKKTAINGALGTVFCSITAGVMLLLLITAFVFAG